MLNKILKAIKFSNGRLPDFLIIGAQKSGTTSLFQYLSYHDLIVLPKVKEIHFFDLNYSKGKKWYKRQFPYEKKSNCITGEATPYYLYHPIVPERVFQMIPKIKLIVLLRNPIERAFSYYMSHVKYKSETANSFEEALELEAERIKSDLVNFKKNPNFIGKNHQRYSYLSRGLYFEQITRWFKYFEESQFLFLESEFFFSDSTKALNDILKFLNLDGNFDYNDNFLKVENKVQYSDEILPETRLMLNEYFYTPNQKLYQLLNKDFKWQ